MGPANRDPVCCKFPVQIWVPSKGLDLEGEFCIFFCNIGVKESLTHLSEHPCLQSGRRQFLLLAGMICVQI